MRRTVTPPRIKSAGWPPSARALAWQSGNTLIYGTGGVAFGGVRNNAAYLPNLGPLGSTSESKTRVGWTAGGGIEHMWSRNWTIALEGLYVDLGKKVVVNTRDSDKTTRFSNKAVIGRVKVNYKW